MRQLQRHHLHRHIFLRALRALEFHRHHQLVEGMGVGLGVPPTEARLRHHQRVFRHKGSQGVPSTEVRRHLLPLKHHLLECQFSAVSQVRRLWVRDQLL